MSELRKKRVIRRGQEIGAAATWDEVEAALVAFGLAAADARRERLTLSVEAPDAFHIVAPGTQAELCAGVRAAKGIEPNG